MIIILDSTTIKAQRRRTPPPQVLRLYVKKNQTSNSKQAGTGKISAGEVHVQKISEHMKQAAKLKFM